MSDLLSKLIAYKVAIYVRVSTHWQVDKDSLTVQKKELAAYCEMVLGIKDYVIFEDPGFSAASTDRPMYQQMMSRIRSGEFTHLLVWKLDRISRNLLDFAMMYEELQNLGIVFVSRNERFDTSTAMGEAMLKIILIFAELERKTTAERVTAVMMSRASDGKWNGGKVPYGYRHTKKTDIFTIDEAEAFIYRKCVELYLQERSILSVTRYLNSHNFKTAHGNNWTVPVIAKMLSNDWYLGTYKYNVHKQGDYYKANDPSEWIVVENHHEALIDKEKFDTIQKIMRNNKRGGNQKGKTTKSKYVHIFAGLAECGCCGGNMIATLDRERSDGYRPSIYACSGRRHNNGKCSNKYISDNTLGPFIFNLISNIMRAKDNTGDRTSLDTLQQKILRGDVFDDVESIDDDGLSELKEILSSPVEDIFYSKLKVTQEISDAQETVNILQAQKSKNERALSRLNALYLYSDNDMPEKDYILEREKIANEITKLDEQISKLSVNMDNDKALSNDFIRSASYFLMVENLLSDRYVDYEKSLKCLSTEVLKAFVNSVVKRIFVLDGKVTSVTFLNGLTLSFNYKE